MHYAVSLGHHRSLIVYLSTADLLRTSFRMTPEQEAAYRAYAGDGLFRLSVGLEDAEDIIADLEQALGSARAAPRAVTASRTRPRTPCRLPVDLCYAV